MRYARSKFKAAAQRSKFKVLSPLCYESGIAERKALRAFKAATQQLLLYGHTLGEIARTVDILALANGDVVCQ